MTDGEFDAVLTAIAQLPSDADSAPDPVLAGRMRKLVRATAMLEAALAAHTGAFDARGAAGYDGQTSTRAWLRSRLRLGAQASQLLEVGRQLHRLPMLAKAFAAGEITLEHAATLARLAAQVDAEQLLGYEEILLELARQAPPAQLRAACDHLRQLLDRSTDERQAARQRRGRYLAASRTIEGMVHLQGALDPASGDVLLAALRAAMPAPAEYEERTPAQRRADALTEVCAGWLASGDAPTSGGMRPQVQVTVSLAALRSSQPGSSQPEPTTPGTNAPAYQADSGGMAGGMPGDVPMLPEGQPIPLSEARRLACDAGILPVVLGGDGEVLDIGRQSRAVPTALRRALQLRDGGCRFAGCDRPASWCDAHHVWAWADGGPTALSNLLLLCRYHHTLMHEGWRMSGHPDGTIHFRRPDGTRLDLVSRPRGLPPARRKITHPDEPD